MSLVECKSRADADKLMAGVCGDRSVHMQMSPSTSVVSSITLTQYVHTHSFVAVGVFYQSPVTDASTRKRVGPKSFDFWGFVSGDVLRSNCGAGDTIAIKREWCSMLIVGCHDSFDAYKNAMNSGAMGREVGLMDFEWAMSARLQLYYVASGRYTGLPLVGGSRIHRMMHLIDEDSVWIDLLSYRTVMMFASCRRHRMNNKPANDAFMRAWHLAECKLFSYRTAHFTQDNLETIVTYIDKDEKIEKVKCDDEYARIMGDSMDDDADEYATSVRAFLPAGGYRFRAPFEMAAPLIASRDVFINAGFAYLSNSDLYRVMIRTVNMITADNMSAYIAAYSADIVAIDGHNRDEPWWTEQRTRSIYQRCFVPAYTETIKHYGFSVSERAVTHGVAPRGDDTAHQLRLDAVLAASPPCMGVLMDRAMNTKVKEHNQYHDRSNATQYLIRMAIPVHIVKPSIRAKVMISYEKPESEWKSLEKSIDFEEKRMRNPKDNKNVFVPPCHWIIEKGGIATTLVCPYAVRLQSGRSAAQALTATQLVAQSKFACGKKWQVDANIKTTATVYSPDEYTTRMMEHRAGKKASVTQKRKL